MRGDLVDGNKSTLVQVPCLANLSRNPQLLFRMQFNRARSSANLVISNSFHRILYAVVAQLVEQLHGGPHKPRPRPGKPDREFRITVKVRILG